MKILLMVAGALLASGSTVGQTKPQSSDAPKSVQGFDPYLPKECRGKKPGEIEEVPMQPFEYCAQSAWVNADKELNRVYQRVRLFMRSKGKYDESDCWIGIQQADGKCPTYEDALIQSQRAWILLRDANSRLGGYADHGSDVVALDFYFSREEETVERIKWLNDLLKTYQEPNPNGG